jgi:hypothetical protein
MFTKTPANMVQKECDKLTEFQAQTKKLQEQIERLG